MDCAHRATLSANGREVCMDCGKVIRDNRPAATRIAEASTYQVEIDLLQAKVDKLTQALRDIMAEGSRTWDRGSLRYRVAEIAERALAE